MRRFVILFVLLIFVLGCNKPDADPVYILAPEGLLPEHVLLDFEWQTGSQVMVDEYDYGESLEGALTEPGMKYDLIIMDKIFGELLREQGLVISAGSPYLSGEIWVGRNTELAPEPVKNWKSLWDKKYNGRLGVLRDPVVMVSIALLASGHEKIDEMPDDLGRVKKMLADIRREANMKFSGFHMEPLYSGELEAAITHSSALKTMEAYGSRVASDRPFEGTLGSTLYLVPVKDMPHKDSARKFYDFLIKPENLKMVSFYSGSSMEPPESSQINDLNPEVKKKMDEIYRETFDNVR